MARWLLTLRSLASNEIYSSTVETIHFNGRSLMFLNQHGLPWSCRPM